MEYNEQSARLRITRNGGKFKGQSILVKKPGLKLLSAIDYLVNYQQYNWNPIEELEGESNVRKNL